MGEDQKRDEKIHQRNADHLAEDPGCCQGCEACPPDCRDCTGCQRDCECYSHPEGSLDDD